MIAIDTDVLAVYHIFHNDPRYDSAKDFWAALVSECFSRIQRGIRLGDAVILWTLEANQGIESFITWNTKHFKEKTPIKILTPAEFV